MVEATAASRAPPGAESPPVPLLLALLGDLHRHNVTYCYWKSGGRVDAALAGETDLDLLIAREDRHRAEAILVERGFKLFPSVANRDHPALASFLGFDELGGRIVHLHLHFRLVVGETLLKNYQLPWEAAILAQAVWHPTLLIRVLDPASEALLLVVRAGFELRRTDPVALRHWAATRRKFELDRQRLTAQLDRATLRRRAGAAFDDNVAEMIVAALFDGRPVESHGRLRRRIRRELAAHRAYNAVEARLRGWMRAVLWAAGGWNQRVLHAPRPWNRRVPGGGCLVAVIGVDGSGKTTTAAAIRDWLGSEVDVMPVYFGTGAGRPSLLLLPFKMMVPLVSRHLGTRPRGASHGLISDRAPGPLYSLLMTVWATVVAMEKRTKLLAAHRGAKRGLVVIADRYPQNEDVGYSDGPLLPRLTRSPAWLRRIEAHVYALASRLPPDLVLKLEVTAETAARREPDMDPTVICQRIEAARRLAFAGARVVRLDAERPLRDLIRSAKREIWRLL